MTLLQGQDGAGPEFVELRACAIVPGGHVCDAVLSAATDREQAARQPEADIAAYRDNHQRRQ